MQYLCNKFLEKLNDRLIVNLFSLYFLRKRGKKKKCRVCENPALFGFINFQADYHIVLKATYLLSSTYCQIQYLLLSMLSIYSWLRNLSTLYIYCADSFIYDFVRFLEFLKKLLKYSKRKVVSLHSRSYKLRSEIQITHTYKDKKNENCLRIFC